jgi:hypothetical protein
VVKKNASVYSNGKKGKCIVNISNENYGCLHVQFVFSRGVILFLNGTKYENDTRTFIVNLILILPEIRKKGKSTHCWLYIHCISLFLVTRKKQKQKSYINENVCPHG